MKRFLSFILAVSIFLSVTAVPVNAQDIVKQEEITIPIPSDYSMELADEDQLFSAYLDKQFFGELALFGTAAREYLNTVEQSVYDNLKTFITQIAYNGGSTETVILPSDISGLVYSWPTGADVITEFENQVNVTDVWTALVHDCPYELYWFDKNRERASFGVTTVDDGTNVFISQFTVILPVSMNWRRSPAYYTTVTADVSKVKLAVENAVYIADKYASKDDYTKLTAFKDEICALVDYNKNEIIGGNEYVNNSSWQIINVFDEDAATKAVSDGYAKAFQYLCDLSDFDNAQCYTIKGAVDGVEYMWNIVTMEDGKSYLVDIASCDAGMPGKYGQYYFAGYDDGGRWSGFVVNDRRYSYHSNNNLFDIDLLILADKDYLYIPQGTVDYGQCGDNAYWLLNEDGNLTIQGWGDMWGGYSTSDTGTVMPPWYNHRESIKNIVVNEGITSIPEYRFYLCQYAISATIPDTVTSIGEMAFYSCMELKELHIPDSVTKLGQGAFGNCTSLEKINIPRNITEIPAWLLSSAAITEIVIPNGVTTIGDYAFYLCNNLASVTVPATLKTVGESAFYAYPAGIENVFFRGDENLWNGITFDQYNENILQGFIHLNHSSDGVYNIIIDVSENGSVLVDKEKATEGETVTITATPDKNYEISGILVNGVKIEGNTFVVASDSIISVLFTEIDDGMISYGKCGDNATWILSNENVLTISGTGSMYDFSYYDNAPWYEYRNEIKKVIVNDGITSIGDYAFYGCESLAEITTADSIEVFGEYAFYDCKALKECTLPYGVTIVSGNMFQNCTSLETVNIPDTVTSIGWRAFYGCASLEKISMPSVVSVYTYAFANCTSLESVFLSGKDADSLFIDEFAFYNCTNIKTVQLDGVRYVAPSSFKSCTSLEKVVLSCDSISGDYIKLTKLGRSAFEDCRNLKTIHIPLTVTLIQDSAFKNCTSITAVYFQGTEEQWKQITIERNNDALVDANIIFNHNVEVPAAEIVRISGDTRYKTAFAIADATKENLGIDKFETVIIASGNGFADALAGSYLAKVKNAPILLASGTQKNNAMLKDYVNENLIEGGTIYILGDAKAVPISVDNTLSAYTIRRVAGNTRYATNMKILDEAGVTGGNIIVATGTNFADSLSASAVGLPILLLNGTRGSLTDRHKTYMENLDVDNIYILGSQAAVNTALEEELKRYGNVERIGGRTRYDTSVKVAQKFFNSTDSAVLAYALNYPDGLCGGPLAMSMNAPLILTKSNSQKYAKAYALENGITNGAVLGGEALIDDVTAKDIFCADLIKDYE